MNPPPMYLAGSFMRRPVTVVVFVVILALASLPSMVAQGKKPIGQIDQKNDLCSSGGILTYYGVKSWDPIGQSFVPEKPWLHGVDLFLEEPYYGIPSFPDDYSGTVAHVSIHRATIYGSVVVRTTSVVPDHHLSWWHFDFAGRVRLVTGQTYVIHVYLEATQPPGRHDLGLAFASTANAYPPGAPVLSGTENPARDDFCFRTYFT